MINRRNQCRNYDGMNSALAYISLIRDFEHFYRLHYVILNLLTFLVIRKSKRGEITI